MFGNASVNTVARSIRVSDNSELGNLFFQFIILFFFFFFGCRCSVCLGDYQAEDKLQQIPVCGHTFHMDCIDLWLATHTTCPLCRLSLLASTKSSTEPPDNSQAETSHRPDDAENCDEGSPQYCSQSSEDPSQLDQQMSSSSTQERV